MGYKVENYGGVLQRDRLCAIIYSIKAVTVLHELFWKLQNARLERAPGSVLDRILSALWKAQIGEREPRAFVEYFLNIVQNVRMFVVFAVDSTNVIWYNNKKALFPHAQ